MEDLIPIGRQDGGASIGKDLIPVGRQDGGASIGKDLVLIGRLEGGLSKSGKPASAAKYLRYDDG